MTATNKTWTDAPPPVSLSQELPVTPSNPLSAPLPVETDSWSLPMENSVMTAMYFPMMAATDV